MLCFRPMTGLLCAGALVAACLATAPRANAVDQRDAPEHTAAAHEILRTAGIHGGVVVHLGCGDGRLTAALRATERYVVQGLEADPAAVGQARRSIEQMDLCGPASIERFDGRRLPYAENVVNLVLAERLGQVSLDEAMRVLAPGGVLLTKESGRWKKTTKSWPGQIDQWTHFLHDATNNAVAHDELVGPPRRLQWTAGPPHTRSHEHTPSIFALVSSQNRIFYIADTAPVASLRKPPDWRLVARDAFNGLFLWQQPVESWFPYLVNWGRTPPELQRRLVAAGDRVFATLGFYAPLSMLDAATGRVLRIYEGTPGAEEVILDRGLLLVALRQVTEQRRAEYVKLMQLTRQDDSPLFTRDSADPLVRRFGSSESSAAAAIVALEAASGRVLWRKAGSDVSRLRRLSLCAQGDRVFYQNGGTVVCVDRKGGETVWETEAPPLWLVHKDRLICADGRQVVALSAADGSLLWQHPSLLVNLRDVFVAGGALWLGGFKPFDTGRQHTGPPWGPYFAVKHDLAGGQVLMQVEPDNPGHHHRCYQNKATDRYILGGRRGTEFIDLATGEVLWNSWARGVCKYGVMPCNGLLYAPPHACACYMAAKLKGFNALASGDLPAVEAPITPQERLHRGPGWESGSPLGVSAEPAAEWPTYRHDAARSGRTLMTLALPLKTCWQAEFGSRLTSPTAAEGKVFVASVDKHRLFAVDAPSGRLAWHFTASARIDSPPTIHRGRAVVGSRDGRVYSLRNTDGAIAWQFQAAREPRFLVADGQLESAWPVSGAILVHDTVAYVAAGRSTYLDGGIDLYRLDAQSGKVLGQTALYSPDPQTGRQPPQFAPSAMPGQRNDILASDEQYLYLRDMVLDRNLREQPQGNPHLFTLTDFLDDSWAHRSYWIFGHRCSISSGCSGREKGLIYGRLLVFDEGSIYGYGRADVHWSNQLEDGPYRVFARGRSQDRPRWTASVPTQVRAMVVAGDMLLAAGPRFQAVFGPEPAPGDEPGLLIALSAADGKQLGQFSLEAPPVFDGMAASAGKLFVAMENGRVACLGPAAQ